MQATMHSVIHQIIRKQFYTLRKNKNELLTINIPGVPTCFGQLILQKIFKKSRKAENLRKFAYILAKQFDDFFKQKILILRGLRFSRKVFHPKVVWTPRTNSQCENFALFGAKIQIFEKLCSYSSTKVTNVFQCLNIIFKGGLDK